ncbi:MAG: hypothetical protein AAGH79_06075 [Bacteroidota bacterium]
MAKFRMNHQRKGKGSSTVIIRLGLLFFLGLVAFTAFFLRQNEWFWEMLTPTTPTVIPPEERFYLPTADTIQHQSYFSRGLDSTGQLQWLAFPLEGKQIPIGERSRPGTLEEQRTGVELSGFWPPVASVQNTCKDYLIAPLPAEIRPLPAYWGYWAGQFDEIYIVTGPVPDSSNTWFSAILDPVEPEVKGLGLLRNPMNEWTAVSIDSLENIIQLDLFESFFLDSLETIVEQTFTAEQWAWKVE